MKDPLTLKHELVADWAEGERRYGFSPDVNKIEKTVSLDLSRWEQERKAQVARARTKAKEQKDVGDRLDKTTDGTTWKKTLRQQRTPDGLPTYKCLCGECKYCKMTRRLAWLMMADVDGKPRYPAFWRELNHHNWSWKLGVGEYRRLSKADGARMLIRKLEDLCDRSNALPGLGNWWVK